MDKNAEKDFLDNLKGDEVKVGDELLGGEIKQEEKPAPEKEAEDDSPRNRREKRFVREMENIRREAQSEREARIAAEERAKALLELGSKASLSDDPDEMKFYGDTPEGKFAKAFLEKKFSSLKEQAKAEALEEIRREREAAMAEEKNNSDEIDNGFAQVEDQFDVDLSGDTKDSKKLRDGFIDFLKDLTTDAYPDFIKSFEVYSKLQQGARPDNSRQKQLADRSMAGQGNAAAPTERKFRSGREYIDYLQSLNS